MKNLTTLLLLTWIFNLNYAQRAEFIKDNYTKKEVYIPMRDGVRLFTAIYTPKDTSGVYPIMMVKTPYGIKPYGEKNFPEAIGPSFYLEKEKYIFVHQDTRGMFMSEGTMLQMTPHLPVKPDSSFVDNSTDTWDAVEWLIHHTNNNGKVGLWGISYRGFYASSGIIDAHPAIKCSSPQACIADWFVGDDVHHNGAFALLPSYNFAEVVDQVREPYFTDWLDVFDYPIRDAYNFFLQIGPLSDVNKNWFNSRVPGWDSIVMHPNYDSYWQERNILPHLKNIKPAVMVTGGLFDHENLYGSLRTYHSINEQGGADTRLILGPWIHGGWARTNGKSFGILNFGKSTSDFYQQIIELPFFNYHLKGKGSLNSLARAMVFSSGSNTWYAFNEWPPEDLKETTFYLNKDFLLGKQKSADKEMVYDSYVSDPAHPVPYTQVFHPMRLFYNKEYMVEDQRFAGSRPDVLSYQSEILTDSLTMMGPVKADLFISSTGSDYDIVVKLIDVYPDTLNRDYYDEPFTEKAGFQQLVRTEIFRVKYRKSYEYPEPITPNEIENIQINLNDVSHCFLPGHRIMVQIQSSMFPLYDRNPQIFMNIYEAKKEDYQKAEIRIYRSKEFPSSITVGILKK
jgi:hypothetical protein